MIGITICLISFSVVYSLPQSFTDNEGVPINFIGESSNEITTTVLQGCEENANFVFSPFGYSVILAILSEGAGGDTKNELVAALHLPEDLKIVRETYKLALQRMKDTNATIKPEFKNYFYVYKNFTIEQNYKDILLEHYFTEVKSTERPDYNDNEEPITDHSNLVSESASVSETASTEANVQPVVTSTSTDDDNVTEKVAQLLSLEKDLAGDIEQSGITKIRKERIKRLAKRFFGINLDEKPKREVSSLSANRLIGGKYDSKLSRMLIFNGLYFKGSWKSPFHVKQTEDHFYLSETDKKSVKMMYSIGKFYVGEIPELDATILRIPYKGERYSFLILLPTTRNGLSKLVQDLTGYSLRNVYKHLKEKHLQVSMPSFDFQSISYMKEPLKKHGVTSIFSEKGDLSGISPNEDLFVDDLVQLVTIHVDNEMASPNFLTASSVATRTVTEKFIADHPFLFFVQDHKENLIVAAGKLIDPTITDE